ncbi:MAG: histidine phosphatase family protein [Actinomycetota bacterium]
MVDAQLYLLRHAKSAWDVDVPDRERALAPRGRKAAPLMGRFLADVGEAPELVLTSGARRAHDTAALAGAAGDWSAPVEVVSELYGATAGELVEVVRRRSRSVDRVLVVGHEPGMSQAIATLCGRVEVRFPTAALARIDLAVRSWRDVAAGSGALRWLVTPRLLRSAGRR